MKGNNYVNTLLRTKHGVTARPRLIAEFNHNRYANTVVDNTIPEEDEGYDRDVFPIESIIEGFRPDHEGIVRAQAGKAKVVNESGTLPVLPRYITTSENDVYKYWVGPHASNTNGTMPVINGYLSWAPYVLYNSGVRTNKVLVQFESTRAKPNNYSIQVKTSAAGAWTTVYSSTSAPANGRLQLWYNGTAWTTTQNLENATKLYGVRVLVNSVNVGSAHLGLIELGLRYEVNLTPYLIGTSDSFDVGDSDTARPIGVATSNIGTIELKNMPIDMADFDKGFLFNGENPNSPYFGLTRSNVKFTLDYLYDCTSVGGSAQEVVRQYVMFSEADWSLSADETGSISVRDESKFLQEIKPAPQAFTDINVVRAAWKLLHSVGFHNIVVEANSTDAPVLDYFWVRGDKPVWEELQELSKATQMAFYFNGSGQLVIKTRSAAYNKARTASWTIYGEKVGTALPDLISESPEQTAPANVVRVKYNPLAIEKSTLAVPVKSAVWSPNTITLGSSDLRKDLSATGQYVYLNADDVDTWPYQGYMQINAEVMHYNAKEFAYWPEGATSRRYIWVSSHSEYKDAMNNRNIAKANDAYFTGALRLDERGCFETEAALHHDAALGIYDIDFGTNGAANRSKVSGAFRVRAPGKKAKKKKIIYSGRAVDSEKGYIQLRSGGGYTNNNWLIAKTGNGNNLPADYFGTRVKFTGSSKAQRAGLYLYGSGSRDEGYYVELRPSSAGMKELLVYRRNASGVSKVVGRNGYDAPVLMNQWNEIFVWIRKGVNADLMTVQVNGRDITGIITIPSADRPYAGGRIGFFTRGKANAHFDYVFGVNGEGFSGGSDYSDDWTFTDMYKSGYMFDTYRQSLYSQKYYRRRARRRNKKRILARHFQFYDEFGPVAHEIREMDVVFDGDTPVFEAFPYYSNGSGIALMNWEATHFSAKFLAVNTSRDDEPFNGNGFSASVSGYQPKYQGEQEVVVRNEQGVRIYGEIELEVASPWLQSKSQAQALANWIKTHWETSTSTISVEIFGNPLIEVGDVVALHYPMGSFSAGTKFFVVSADNDYSNAGIATTLKLRKV